MVLAQTTRRTASCNCRHAGTQALLAQLGYNHVQGFGIGNPMPFEETLDWMRVHEAKFLDPPKIRGHHTS